MYIYDNIREDLCTFMIIYVKIYVHTFMIIPRWILLTMRNVPDESYSENKTHFKMLNNIFFFRKSCHLWDNVEKCGRAKQAADDNIMQIAFPKATMVLSVLFVFIRPMQFLTISIHPLYSVPNFEYHMFINMYFNP